MATLQPCEVFFDSCEEQIARENETLILRSRADLVHATLISAAFKTCMVGKESSYSGGGTHRSLQDVAALEGMHKCFDGAQ